MNLMHIIRKILSSVQLMYVLSSNERFVKYLKNNGVVVGREQSLDQNQQR